MARLTTAALPLLAAPLLLPPAPAHAAAAPAASALAAPAPGAAALAAPAAPAASEPSAAPQAADLARAVRVEQAMRRFEHEPTVIEVQQAAVRYFQVHPEAIGSLRARAHSRALAPLLTGSYAYERSRRLRDVDDPVVPLQTDDRITDQAHSPRIASVWDTRDAVFNPSELDTYALVGMQLNVLREVSRFYYIRQQVLLTLAADAPADPQAHASLRLRAAEYTALLDAFTGGWFSRERDARRAGRSAAAN